MSQYQEPYAATSSQVPAGGYLYWEGALLRWCDLRESRVGRCGHMAWRSALLEPTCTPDLSWL